MDKLLQYWQNNWKAFDRLCNTILGGDPNFTISGRMGADVEAGKCRVCFFLCKMLNFFQENHCRRAAEHDRQLIAGDDKSVIKD